MILLIFPRLPTHVFPYNGHTSSQPPPLFFPSISHFTLIILINATSSLLIAPTMYQPGSLSSLLAPKQKKQKQEDIPTSSTGGLSKLFSDSSLQKFARVLKPEEFGAVKKKKVAGDGEDNDKDTKKAAKGPKKREGKKAKWDDAKRKERDEKKGSSGSVSSSSSVPSISDIKSDKKEKKRKAAEALEKDTTTNDSKGSDSIAKKSKTDDKAVEAEPEEEPVSNGVSHDTSKDHLTAFFGNVPISETVKSIKKYCTQFGEVESVRLRSVPIAGTAVDDAGNQNLVRKVCANSRNFMEIKGSFNAYVVYTTEDAVTNSLRVNNQLWGTRHLRVDRMKPTVPNPNPNSHPYLNLTLTLILTLTQTLNFSSHPIYFYSLIICTYNLHTGCYHCHSCLIRVGPFLLAHYLIMRTKKTYEIISPKCYRTVMLILKEFDWYVIQRR